MNKEKDMIIKEQYYQTPFRIGVSLEYRQLEYFAQRDGEPVSQKLLEKL